MAKAESPLLNGLKGKLGGGLFIYNRMDTTVIRRSPGKRKSSSEKQQGCMSDFSLMSYVYPFVKLVLNLPVWNLAGAEVKMTANNYFSRVNKGIFNSRGGIRDFKNFTLAEGTLLNPDGMTLEPASEDTFRVTWIAEDSYRTRGGSDRLMVLVLLDEGNDNIDFAIAWAANVNGTRQDGTGSFTIPEEAKTWIQEQKTEGIAPHLHAYCFFGAPDGKAYSRSVYFPLPIPEE